MWTANAATVMPAADTRDGRTHFVTANLREMSHRAIEPPVTARILRAIFADPTRFDVHEALATDAQSDYGDEGAANHTRLTTSAANGGEQSGVHFFVYGAAENSKRTPTKFPRVRTAPPASVWRISRNLIARVACLPSKTPTRSTRACSTTM